MLWLFFLLCSQERAEFASKTITRYIETNKIQFTEDEEFMQSIEGFDKTVDELRQNEQILVNIRAELHQFLQLFNYEPPKPNEGLFQINDYQEKPSNNNNTATLAEKSKLEEINIKIDFKTIISGKRVTEIIDGKSFEKDIFDEQEINKLRKNPNVFMKPVYSSKNIKATYSALGLVELIDADFPKILQSLTNDLLPKSLRETIQFSSLEQDFFNYLNKNKLLGVVANTLPVYLKSLDKKAELKNAKNSDIILIKQFAIIAFSLTFFVPLAIGNFLYSFFFKKHEDVYVSTQNTTALILNRAFQEILCHYDNIELKILINMLKISTAVKQNTKTVETYMENLGDAFSELELSKQIQIREQIKQINMQLDKPFADFLTNFTAFKNDLRFALWHKASVGFAILVTFLTPIVLYYLYWKIPALIFDLNLTNPTNMTDFTNTSYYNATNTTTESSGPNFDDEFDFFNLASIFNEKV